MICMKYRTISAFIIHFLDRAFQLQSRSKQKGNPVICAVQDGTTNHPQSSANQTQTATVPAGIIFGHLRLLWSGKAVKTNFEKIKNKERKKKTSSDELVRSFGII